MRYSRWSVWYGGLLLALVLSVGLAVPASATYSEQPVGPSGWAPDGPILAVAVSGSRVFVGGAFSGGVAALDASTGELLWTGNAEGGPVRALALSSDGTHVIVGGGFISVGGATHRALASLQVADGTVEPGWRASAGGMVRDIVVRGDVAYFGGNFAQHNGLVQGGLGAVLVSTGKAFGDFDAATDAEVYGLATDGARLFVAGKFTSVDGQPRNQLASVTLATHSLDAWAPARACAGCNLVWDVLVDGSTVYTAGRNASAVSAYDTTTGARRWRVAANGDAQALALVDGVLYAGGHFVEIGEPRQPRIILAALNPATGAIDSDFQPRFVDVWPGIWALAATSDRLYAGGHFTAAGASPPKRYPYFAMFGPATETTNTAPTAQAVATPSSAAVGDPITFSAAGSSDPDTPANGLTYVWDFGNGGTTADATGVTATHAYESGGRYTATVAVTDPQGATDSATAEVVVSAAPPPSNTAPTARAVATPSSAAVGDPITFSAAGSSDPDTPANGLTYVWDFGNGGTTADATGVTATHDYQSGGRYTATVTVTDPQGATDSATVVVVVSTDPVMDTTAPEARVRFNPHPAFTRADITLDGARSSDDTTHSDDLTYAWRLKRGTHTATGERVTVRFKKPGIHRVRLTVTDEAGNSDTSTRKIRVRSFVHCQTPRVDRTGGWRVRGDDRAVGGRYCDSNGRQRGRDVVSFTFQGTEVTVIHGVARRGGSARVFIDGERRRALSFRGTQRGIEFLQKRTYRQLGQGQHIIRIEMKHKTGFLEGFMYGG